MIPPRSLMGAVDKSDIAAAAKDSELWKHYAEEIDRESARELLAKKVAAAADAELDIKVPKPEKAAKAPAPSRGKKKDDGVVVGYLKSQEGRRMINRVARGVFGLLTKGK
jgi:hypothetical protein